MTSLKAKLANLPPMRSPTATPKGTGSPGVERHAPPPAPVPAPTPTQGDPQEGGPARQIELFACGPAPIEEVELVRERPGVEGAGQGSRGEIPEAASPGPPGAGGPGGPAPRRWKLPQRSALTSGPPAPRPSLDELRDRIATIVARGAPPTPRADPTRGELPFVLEQTERGPLYVYRARSPAGARVGRAPLVAARHADPAMLALLALDPVLAGCDVRRALFLDTETTGLAGGTGTVPFLIGLAQYDEASGSFLLEQLLLRRLGEEGPMLALLAERIASASMLVTYNGKAFDMPLLRTRYVMNRLVAPPSPPHLDLVHLARRIHKSRLKTRTLLALEHNVLGRVRVGDTHGEDIVACYAHFLRTSDEEALFGVVEHNAADVLAMVALVGLYGEPVGSLDAEDLADAARTVRRAGAVDLAAELAEQAVARGGGVEARRARGEIAKARGDKARALADYESLAEEVDDPSIRLELAKLYEHHVRSFAKALSLVERGTGEGDEAHGRRRARLKRKLERSS